jgi:hypothetical protein
MENPGNPWLDLMGKWPALQRDMFKQWMDAWSKAEPLGKAGGGPGPSSGAESAAWTIYRQWMEYLKELVGRFPAAEGGSGPETFSRMLSGADTYARLYAWWTDFFREAQERMGAGELDSRLFDELYHKWSQGYEEMVKGIFAAAMPESLQWVAELLSGDVYRLYIDEAVHFWSPWIDFAISQGKKAARGEQPGIEGISEAYEEWRRAYEESFGRLIRMPAMGYYREAAEKFGKAMDDLVEFNLVLADFYAALGEAGRQGMEKLQGKLAGALQGGDGGPSSFRELYRMWWQTNEEVYIELFRTEEFSRLLGHLVERGMNFRESYQGFLEEATKELPFPNRSEMDHLYKTVYELRKEVRSLKREVAALEEEGRGAKKEGGR